MLVLFVVSGQGFTAFSKTVFKKGTHTHTNTLSLTKSLSAALEFAEELFEIFKCWERFKCEIDGIGSVSALQLLQPSQRGLHTQQVLRDDI